MLKLTPFSLLPTPVSLPLLPCNEGAGEGRRIKRRALKQNRWA